MRKGYLTHKSIAPLLIALSLAAPGCKSGWKMPSPSNMWPWGRNPSAETLSGTPTKPTLESPANKHTPSAIASNAAGTKSTTTSAPTSYGGNALAATGSAKPTYGGAATANGYQTGPYGMSSQQAATSSSVASTGYPSGSYVPPNAYSGTAGLPSSNLPPASTPNVSNPYASNSPPGTTAASMASVTMPPTGGPTATMPPSGYSMPNAMPSPSTSMPSMQPSMPPASGYAGTSASSVSFPVPGSTAGTMPNGSMPMPGPSMPTGNAGSLPPSSYAGAPQTNQPTSTPDGYRPGTTARANVYNFSSGSTTVPVNSTNPNVPTTATLPSSGYGSFQIPANTATAPNTMPAPTMR